MLTTIVPRPGTSAAVQGRCVCQPSCADVLRRTAADTPRRFGVKASSDGTRRRPAVALLGQAVRRRGSAACGASAPACRSVNARREAFHPDPCGCGRPRRAPRAGRPVAQEVPVHHPWPQDRPVPRPYGHASFIRHRRRRPASAVHGRRHAGFLGCAFNADQPPTTPRSNRRVIGSSPIGGAPPQVNGVVGDPGPGRRPTSERATPALASSRASAGRRRPCAGR